MDKLVRIAITANVTLDWLAMGKGEMQTQPSPAKPHLTVVPSSGRTATPEERAANRPRRWDAIIQLVEGIEDDKKREKLMEEFLSRSEDVQQREEDAKQRAEDAKQLTELKRTVQELKKYA